MIIHRMHPDTFAAVCGSTDHELSITWTRTTCPDCLYTERASARAAGNLAHAAAIGARLKEIAS